ncbi:hypothetical protein [Paenibacillus alvei]|uniref:hypothetical protein n=1 Tax=Paenibacillus alvei TaxID=44250 RepID=UPI00227F821A|nr:hypothetical protein [Paenibacillus alvei]
MAANWLSVMIVVTGTSAVRSKVSANKNADPFRNKRFQRAQVYFHSYGAPGMSLIGPIIGANHIGAFVCVLANADKRRIMLWQHLDVHTLSEMGLLPMRFYLWSSLLLFGG